jgi:large subunit ribosomal protein L18
MATLRGRPRRKLRIRKKISGSTERPRLTVFRSNKQIYAQVVDDTSGRTLASATSLGRGAADGGKRSLAQQVGEALAGVCIEKGITRVVFDRNGYMYHGRVKALADAARKGGLQF